MHGPTYMCLCKLAGEGRGAREKNPCSMRVHVCMKKKIRICLVLTGCQRVVLRLAPTGADAATECVLEVPHAKSRADVQAAAQGGCSFKGSHAQPRSVWKEVSESPRTFAKQRSPLPLTGS